MAVAELVKHAEVIAETPIVGLKFHLPVVSLRGAAGGDQDGAEIDGLREFGIHVHGTEACPDAQLFGNLPGEAGI